MIGLKSLKQKEYESTPKYDRNIKPCVGLVMIVGSHDLMKKSVLILQFNIVIKVFMGRHIHFTLITSQNSIIKIPILI
jgi:hypothetical protein